MLNYSEYFFRNLQNNGSFIVLLGHLIDAYYHNYADSSIMDIMTQFAMGKQTMLLSRKVTLFGSQMIIRPL